MFDFRTGFLNFAAGTTQVLDGGANPDNPSNPFPANPDQLWLPGKATDYTIQTLGSVTTLHQVAGNITLASSAIERATFAAPVDNGVVATNLTLELARLAVDAYSDAAPGRNWHPLSAIELGLLPTSAPGAALQYALQDGWYKATEPGLTGLANSEADAIVSIGVLNGGRVLSLAFRGTTFKFSSDPGGTLGDLGNDLWFPLHYGKFKPLIDAINAFVGDPSNGIGKVVVSGHSLGASMVQMYMAEHPDTANTKYLALTLALPGVLEVPGQNNGNADDPRMVNFIHTDDPVPQAPGKTHNGSEVYIDTDAAISLPGLVGAAVGLAEHDKSLYYADLVDMVGFAQDNASPFGLSSLGQSLIHNTIYNGPSVQVAVSDNSSSYNGVISSQRGDDFVLGTAGDDRIRWLGGIVPTSDYRVIDGGDGGDTLVLPGARLAWSWPTTSSEHGLNYLSVPVGEVWRIEKLVFTFASDVSLQQSRTLAVTTAPADASPVVYLDGRAPNVQRADADATTLTISGTSDYVETGASTLSVQGSAGADIVMLGGGNQTVAGGGGDDILNASLSASGAMFNLAGGAGDDLILGKTDVATRVAFSGKSSDYAGQEGNDGRLVLQDLRDGAPDGKDTLYQITTLGFSDGDLTIDGYLAAHVPVELVGTGSADVLSPTSDRIVVAYGLDGADSLTGGSRGDDLDGGVGVDTMVGFGGGDLYHVDSSADVVVEKPGEGNDTVVATSDFTLPENVENLTQAAGSGAHIGTGNFSDNRINGNEAADTLNGAAGNDTLFGGGGNDVINGGLGVDLAGYASTRDSATATRDPISHALTITAALDGTDTLRNIEQVKFADGVNSFTFARPGAAVVANFNPAFGWASQDQYPRHVADMNGDGFGDVVGFGIAGVLVSYGAANGTFSTAAVVLADFGQNAGWANDNQFHRIVADVNGDGRADIIGFGFAGTLVSLAKPDGTFTGVTTGLADFGVNQGWANQNGFARVVGDVNGDGKADIVGFGFAGALVALGNGNGTFQGVKTGIANFGVNQGWTSDNSFHRELADVNGDGRADLIGFGIAGTYVALGQADGTFATANLVLADFGANQGWTSNDSFSRLVADVNGDHIGDIVGFGIAGTLVAFGKGDGTFTQAGFDVADFGANQGWTSDNTFHREVADMNHDGLADIVGFGIAGVLVGQNQGDFLI